MLAIDTNVLARYLRNDDPRQSEAARRLIDEEATTAEPLLIVGAVLVEIFWLLKKYQRLPREAIADIFWALLDNAHLTFPDQTAIAAAIDAYAQGPARFPDYLISASALSLGADYTVTFDRDAARHTSFRLLTPGD